MKRKKTSGQAAFYTILSRVKKKNRWLTDQEARSATIAILSRVKKKAAKN